MKEITDPKELKNGKEYILTDGLLKTVAIFNERNLGTAYSNFPLYTFWRIGEESVIETSTSKKMLLNEIKTYHVRVYEGEDDK